MARFVSIYPDGLGYGSDRSIELNADAVLWIEPVNEPNVWNGTDYRPSCVLHMLGGEAITVLETAWMIASNLNDRVRT